MHFYHLDQEGYGNLYYAATVRSMLTSWHNFFFASFDPGGFVAVDKPPLGFWVQCLSVLVFGFNGLSLHLPQAAAGVLSVALLFFLVRRSFGTAAGLLAALILALTPISVAANRNNSMDSQVVLVLLLATWCVLPPVPPRHRLGRLLLCAALIGIGFEIKMLQALMALPAFFLITLLVPLDSLRRWRGWLVRLLRLALAGVVLAVISLAWPLAVDLTPPEQRPYVGSSQNNTVMELIIGHNGINRLGPIAQALGIHRFWAGPGPSQPQPYQPPQNQVPGNPNPQPANPNPQQVPKPQPAPTSQETGAPGIMRLFNRQLAGQASWLLPLALLGAVIIAAMGGRHVNIGFTSARAGALFWSAWLIPQVIFFSFAGLFHRYYLEMLTPAVAALAAGGLAVLWQEYRRPGWRGWLLLPVLLLTAGVEVLLLQHFLQWSRWMAPLILALAGAAGLGLGLLKIIPPLFPAVSAQRAALLSILRTAILLIGLASILIAPAAWAFMPVLGGSDSGLPFAGPELLERKANAAGQARLPGDVRLLEYLNANRQGEKYLLAVVNSHTAAPFILQTGQAVMAMGGFSGSDRILSVEDVRGLVRSRQVRFFWLPAAEGNQANLMRWVMSSCRRVPELEWRPAFRTGTVPQNPQPQQQPDNVPQSPQTPQPQAGAANQLWDCKGKG